MKRYIADALLLAVTFVWGATFILVQDAVSVIPVFPFLAIRFGLAGLLMLAVSFMHPAWRRAVASLRLWLSGMALGVWLFAGYAFQTLGLLYTSAAQAGFITGLSVVLVPLFAIVLLRQKPGRSTWFGVAIATVGLFLLSYHRSTGINRGDALVFLCAVSFALQIVLVGRYAPKFSALPLASVQILTVGVLSAAIASVHAAQWRQAAQTLAAPVVFNALWICILFATVIAYFAQTAFQKFTTPTRTALIFAMEPVFAALSAYLWAGQSLSLSGMYGCTLILLGMLVAEIKGPKRVVPDAIAINALSENNHDV